MDFENGAIGVFESSVVATARKNYLSWEINAAGLMGDGVIDIPSIRRLVEAADYQGCSEVEIFSARNWWRRDPDEVVEVAKERYLQYV